jgi:hypothetical protein
VKCYCKIKSQTGQRGGEELSLLPGEVISPLIKDYRCQNQGDAQLPLDQNQGDAQLPLDQNQGDAQLSLDQNQGDAHLPLDQNQGDAHLPLDLNAH